MDMYFLFPYPKKLRGDFFHFGIFQEDQRTHPKTNEQHGAQTLVPIDIFVMNKCYPLWGLRNCLIATAQICHL